MYLTCLFIQEVHELLRNYDLKYCFVDKYKGTGKWFHQWLLVWCNLLFLTLHSRLNQVVQLKVT